MKGNFHVRFLGGSERETSHSYPVPLRTHMEITPRCRRALNYAKESLARFGQSHVSSAHLVLGLLTLHGGAADNLLRKSGLSVQSVESYLSSRRTSVEESTVQDGVALGKSARVAFERAEAETRARRAGSGAGGARAPLRRRPCL